MISENCLESNEQRGISAIGAGLLGKNPGQARGPTLPATHTSMIAPVFKQNPVASTAAGGTIDTRRTDDVVGPKPYGKYPFTAVCWKKSSWCVWVTKKPSSN
jgi:hypothetical protein